MKDFKNTALVLEGGGLRGVFTCGVLDCFMDNGISFPFTVEVSAVGYKTQTREIHVRQGRCSALLTSMAILQLPIIL